MRADGHLVTISDLTAERFRGNVGPDDMVRPADPNRFHIKAAQAHAARHGTYAADILREETQVAAADNIILQYPIWRGGPPALLKGWIDRVLSYGFAYVDRRRFETGLFKGRRALISATTGGTPERFSEEGAYDTIGLLLMPVRKLALEYMGFEVEEPCDTYAVFRYDGATRDTYIANFVHAAQSIAARTVIRRDAWRTAISELPDNAWTRP